ncbi:hypothetical protein CGL56_10545 [Neolewinella marina]|uniref:histidine kinase n=1 Tax=Neolewinella marina TaxID=438751 RepID=A0A2G0CFZ4_9BACT|nr:hypothetical protein CGL56_10545 [Neolewinella marina]
MLICILWLFLPGKSDGQVIDMVPKERLTISEGLPHNGVSSMLVDSRGYLWVATFDGLARYDGYDVDVYQNLPDRKMLVSNRIRNIREDKRGNLLLGTDDGVSVYHYRQDKFETIYSNTMFSRGINGPLVRKILPMPDDKTIVALTEESGVLIFDVDYQYLKQCIPAGLGDERKIKILFGSALDEHHLLLSTSTGLLVFNTQNCSFESVLKDEIRTSFSSLVMEDGRVLVATDDRLCWLQKTGKQLPEFQWGGSYPTVMGAVDMRTDQRGNLWLASVGQGISVITNLEHFLEGGTANVLDFNTADGQLRSSCLTPAGEDDFWVGSFDRGSFRFSLRSNPFFNSLQTSGPVEFRKSIAFATVVDSNRVLLGGSNGLATVFNTASEAFEPLPASLAGVAGRMHCVYADRRGRLWFKDARVNRLYYAESSDGPLREVNFADVEIPEDYRFDSMTEDSEGNLWLAFQEGVVRLGINEFGVVERGEFLRDHPSISTDPLSRIRYLYADPAGKIMWVGTSSSGLVRIDYQTADLLRDAAVDRYTTANGLPSNFVSSMLRTREGALWIGTERGGVCRITEAQGELSFEAVTTADGLTNNVVKNLLADDQDNLWVSTNVGLNRLSLDTREITGYRRDDGLPFEDFSYEAKKMANGKMLFAGVNGFTLFDPRRIPDPVVAPAVEFGDLRLFNRTINVGDTVAGRVLLTERLRDGSRLRFPHNQSVFSFGVDALHFESIASYYLSYRLLPDNADWLKLPPEQRTINFNNLPPGEYELEVRSCKTGAGCSEPRTIYFDIIPPWWKSTWAYVLYGVIFLGVSAAIVYWITRFQSLRHSIAIEQLERSSAQQLNAEKLRLFSNISHEIKTPVSLIYGPIQLLARRFSKDKIISDNLSLIERQAKKLTRLVEQIQDFQKADANLLKLKATPFNFARFLQEATQDLAFFAKSEGKAVIVNCAAPHIRVCADRDKLEKIIDNLVTNALKHTDMGDVVTVSATATENALVLVVKDTGTGIKAEDLPFVFDRFYQAEDSGTNPVAGSGIGLAFTKRLVELHQGTISITSAEGDGTTVEVVLPVLHPRDEYEADEESVDEMNAEVVPQLLPNITLGEDELAVAAEFRGKRIYLIEDSTDMRRFIEGFLSKYFEVTSFTNGKACLQAMEEEWPDLVLSDVQMPKVDGLSLTAAIKEDFKTSHIPVILLTAFGRDEGRIKGMGSGADAYINKPFSIPVVISTIENLLKNRDKLRHRFNVDLPLTLNKENVGNNEFLERLYEIMRANVDNADADLDTFAKQLLLNRTHFYQKTKEITGMTPHELFKAYRLKRAAELLVQDGLTVNEVYPTTGFKSRSNFSKAFKKKYGVPPSQYAAEAAKATLGTDTE